MIDDKVIFEVVSRLIGPINPSGDDSIDQYVLANINNYGKLINIMISELGEVYQYNKDSPYSSEKSIADHIHSILSEVEENVNYIKGN